MNINVSNQQFTSIQQMQEQIHKKIPNQAKEENEAVSSFEAILKHKQNEVAESELRFSKHANERLVSRKIDLSNEQLERLESGTNKAREKGIKESLVMVDELAFIVNVKSNTVITAVNDTENTVFTNIDGAVIS